MRGEGKHSKVGAAGGTSTLGFLKKNNEKTRSS